jgi:Protein of unknown function (DUF2783)
MTLRTDVVPAGFPVDQIYARLVDMGTKRSDDEARAMLSALTLILINHIGDATIINEAIDLVETIFNEKSPIAAE